MRTAVCRWVDSRTGPPGERHRGASESTRPRSTGSTARRRYRLATTSGRVRPIRKHSGCGTNVDFPTPGRQPHRDRRHSRLDVRARAPEVLAPFSLTAEYRYMDAFDSLLDDDPQRLRLNWSTRSRSRTCRSAVTTYGENTETIQLEDGNKLLIG